MAKQHLWEELEEQGKQEMDEIEALRNQIEELNKTRAAKVRRREIYNDEMSADVFLERLRRFVAVTGKEHSPYEVMVNRNNSYWELSKAKDSDFKFILLARHMGLRGSLGDTDIDGLKELTKDLFEAIQAYWSGRDSDRSDANDQRLRDAFGLFRMTLKILKYSQ